MKTSTSSRIRCRMTAQLAVAAAWAALSCMPAAAQSSQPQFSLKEDTPQTGSHIRREIGSSTRIPVNRRYHELTDAERQVVHDFYEDMAPGDEPPFPADGLKPIIQAVNKAQRELLVEGDLKLIISVDANGQATEVAALTSPSPEMTKFASMVLLLTKFKPAICNGHPCSMQFPFHFEFSVRP